jgi:hypothetical protein
VGCIVFLSPAKLVTGDIIEDNVGLAVSSEPKLEIMLLPSLGTIEGMGGIVKLDNGAPALLVICPRTDDSGGLVAIDSKLERILLASLGTIDGIG